MLRKENKEFKRKVSTLEVTLFIFVCWVLSLLMDMDNRRNCGRPARIAQALLLHIRLVVAPHQWAQRSPCEARRRGKRIDRTPQCVQFANPHTSCTSNLSSLRLFLCIFLCLQLPNRPASGASVASVASTNAAFGRMNRPESSSSVSTTHSRLPSRLSNQRKPAETFASLRS